MPHAVLIDDPPTFTRDDRNTTPVCRVRNAAYHCMWSDAHRPGPMCLHQLAASANSTRGHDDRRSTDFEFASRLAAAPRSARRDAHRQFGPANAGDHTAVDNQGIHPMPKTEFEPPLLFCLTSTRDERRQDTRSCPPRDMKTRQGVPPTFCPPDNREPSHTHRVQPCPLFAGSELQVRLGPLARPAVLVAVEPRRA